MMSISVFYSSMDKRSVMTLLALKVGIIPPLSMHACRGAINILLCVWIMHLIFSCKSMSSFSYSLVSCTWSCCMPYGCCGPIALLTSALSASACIMIFMASLFFLSLWMRPPPFYWLVCWTYLIKAVMSSIASFF